MTVMESTLRRAADMFYEIVSAHSAGKLLTQESLNAVMREKLQDSLRSNDQICELAVDGFELCVRTLAAMGAADVAVHECGECDLEVVS